MCLVLSVGVTYVSFSLSTAERQVTQTEVLVSVKPSGRFPSAKGTAVGGGELEADLVGVQGVTDLVDVPSLSPRPWTADDGSQLGGRQQEWNFLHRRMDDLYHPGGKRSSPQGGLKLGAGG